MIKNYLNKHTGDSKSTKDNTFRAVLLCLNAGKKSLFVSLVFSLISIFPDQLFAQTTDTYTSSGTWTCPDNVISATVSVWGGGGSGGSGNVSGAGGGGGGGYSSSVLTVTPGTVYTVTVGAGATGAGGAGNDGAAGGDSWFSTNTTVMAKGGGKGNYGGSGGTGGAAASGYGTTKYSGGNGASSSGNNGGGGGSSAGTAAGGANGSGTTGATAPSGGGNGGNGSPDNGANGVAGTAPGGGGGGGGDNNDSDGGNGGAGKVTITYTACTPPTVQASAFYSTSVTTTGMTLNWTRGNGANVLIVAKQGSAPTDPTGSVASPNAAYGSGTAVGGGYAVYAGTGTSVALTGLTAGQTYYFTAYEYNAGPCYYLAELSGTFCAANIATSTFGNNSWNVHCYNAGDGLGGAGSWTNNYAGYYNIPSVLSFDTRTGQTYSTAQSWDINGTPSSASGYVGCTVGSDNHSYSIRRQGFPCGNYELRFGNDDRAEIYVDGGLVYTQGGWQDGDILGWTGILGASSTVEIRISEAGGGSFAKLLFTSISTQATTFVPSSITATTMTLGWTRGNGASGVLVVAKAGSAPTDPTTGVAYTANAAYGSGDAVGGGFAVYAGTGTSVNLTGLSAGTTYYFAAYEYNASSCYTNSMVELTGSATTSAPYKATFTGMSTGSANWCVGEVRNVTVTLTNSGTSTWTDAGPDVNIGCKWNYMADYDYRVDAGGLAPAASRTYTFTVTAPGAGSENLRFDVVKEGDCWFANNNGSCGQGNSYSTSSAITISAAPPTPAPITASTTTVTCGSTLALASAAPTGGTISTAGGYRIHTFNSSGTFTTPSGFTPGNVEVLVVGGGGGGGQNGGGGGGGGGVTYNSAYAVTANTAYPITVGTGGATGNNVSGGSPGLQGNNSVFGTITAYGGGGGANRDYGGAATAGRGSGAAGGGGGGGASPQLTAGAANGTGGAGGAGYNNGCNSAGGGGGGVNSSTGTAGTIGGGGGTGGNGGTGVSSAISGTTKYYGAGGGGGTTNFSGCGGGTPWVNGTGGSSVGGNGEGTAAVANSGSGAGADAAGADGVVVIRYPDVSAGTWTSSNTSVATVNPVNGVVTGVAAGSATISYSYTNPGGCASAAVTYAVTVPGVPSAVTASASPNPACTGSSLALTGGATNATSWAWTGPNSFTSTSQSPTVSTNVTTAMAGTYSLIATNSCGSAAVATTAAVSVTTLPAATISYAGSPFCISLGAGQAVTRTGTAGGTYSSTAGLTVDGTTGAINPSTSTAGTYTVTYTIAAASGCAQVTATTSVTIKALPAITGQPSSPAAINAGAGTAVFTVTATGGSITYQWEADDGGWHSIANGAIYSGVTTASLSVINPPGSYNGRKFRCVVSGCAPSVTSDGLATLTVNTLGNQEPCYGTVQNYNVTNVAGVTYTWTYPSGWSVASGQGTNSINLNVGVSSGNVSVTPSTCGGNGTARTLAVTVASVSIAASATTICSGESVTFTATPVNAGTPTYQWTKNGVDIAGEIASTYVSTTLANTDAIAVKMTSSSGCLITSTPINMVVNPASLTASVTISASETNICSGVSVTFTAVPVNGGLTPSYQWKIDGGNVGTNSSTFTSTTLANNNSVTVVMTNSDACILGSPATSNAIVMTVNTSLTASVSIAEDANNICAGTSVTLTATPTNGGTPTYQWKNGATNVGTNSATYTSTTLANNDAITVVMTTSLLCTTPSPVTSNAITMLVNTPIVNNTVSAAQVICTGSTPAALTGTVPTGGNGAYTYLWEQSTTSSTAGFAAASGTNTNSGYSPGALTATTWYRRTVTSAPCSDNVSQAIEITVNTAIVNNTVSVAQSICSGLTPTPIAGSVPTGGNGAYTYSWEVSTTSSTAGFAAIGGATSQDYSPGALAADTWYRRTVASAPCISHTSDAIGITINPNLPASVTVAASTTSICNGTSVVFTPTPTNGGTTPTYQWQKGGVDISGEVFSTYTSSTLADADAIRVVMTSNASPCLTGSPATSNAVTMTVNEIPLATATNNDQTICSGGGFTTMALGTSNSVTGTTFAWVRDNTADVTGIAASGTGNITGVALTNATSVGIIVTFTITPTGPATTNCPGPPITTTILVNPAAPSAPDVISGIANTYAGFNEPYSIAAVTNATTYTWTVPAGWSIASGQGTTAITATAGAAGQNGDITVTASNICGTSAASTFSVTVTANTAAVTTVCEGSSQRYTTQYREGVTYRWTVPSDWTITSGANSNSMTTTMGATSGNVEVIASNSCGDGSVGTLAVTVNPRPVMTNITYTSTCTGVAINIPLTANPASTYSWIAADNSNTTGESTTNQTATTIADVLTSTAAGITTVTYSVTPTSTVGGCIGTAGGVSPQIITVDVNPSGYWTGNVDTKWREPGNWCGIPTCSSDAFIPTSPTGARFPQIEWPDAICRDLTISTGASLEFVTDGLALCGNWLNNGLFIPDDEKATFQGTANQTIGGVAENVFYDLQISNTGASGSDNVTLTQPATVTNVLNLSNGILATDATNILTLTNPASNATNGGNSTSMSFVSGPMRWNGLTGAGPFIFPTGKAPTKWARIAVSDLDGAATDFQAEHFETGWSNVTLADMATNPTPVLKKVSRVEYWHLYRIGASNAKVTLYWENATASGISDCSKLKIAHWDPANATNSGATMGSWENNNDAVTTTGTCGGSASGTIKTNLVATEFSPFTFGDTMPNVNPLPVELLTFNATYNGKTVDVIWKTASEINNDYFTVERSIDGVNFITVGMIVSSQAKGGNSTSVLSYGLNDENVSPGVYYYRLKQTDFNGDYKYSNIDVVEIKGSAEFSFNISPNPSDGTELNSIITAEKDQEIVIAVYDVLGQEIYSQVIVTEQKGNTVYAIDLLQKLSSGVYMITATSNQQVYTKRLVVN